MKVVMNVGLPTGARRFAYRLPIYLYRMGLGQLFGERLLLLHHRGRNSGKPRQVVLEVVEHGGATEGFVVASGWGSKADWYRNVLETPEVTIQVGRRIIPVTALPLTREEGADVFVRHTRRHPKAARHVLSRVIGLSVDGSETDFRSAGRRLPFVRLVPRG